MCVVMCDILTSHEGDGSECVLYCDLGDILTGHEGDGSECVLYCDLGDRRQVEMCVVGHHNTAHQDGHDACNRTMIVNLYQKFIKTS